MTQTHLIQLIIKLCRCLMKMVVKERCVCAEKHGKSCFQPLCYVSFFRASEHLSFFCSCWMMGCSLTSWCESNGKSRCSRAPHRPIFFYFSKFMPLWVLMNLSKHLGRMGWKTDEVSARFHDSAHFKWPVWSFMSGAQGQIFPGLGMKCKNCQRFWCEKQIRLNGNLTSVSLHPFLWREAVMEIIWQRLVLFFFAIYFAHKSLK